LVGYCFVTAIGALFIFVTIFGVKWSSMVL